MKKITYFCLIAGITIIWMFQGIDFELSTEQTKEILNRVFLAEEETKWSDNLLKMSNIIFAMEQKKPSSPVVPETVPATAEAYKPALRNQTSFDIDTDALLSQNLSFLPVKGKTPQVLIVHTHTSEGYAPEERSTDPKKNVTAIGEIIASCLEKQGIKVIHDKTVHDTDYNGSYSRCLETVERQLKKHPTVQIVLDVHRDAATLENGQSLQVVADINGTETGQIMLVAGTDEGGLNHPDWKTNLAFALQLQQAMDSNAPGLSRPLNIRKERFNQHLAPGMLIVEVAASGNSMEEAKKGALLFAKSLCALLPIT